MLGKTHLASISNQRHHIGRRPERRCIEAAGRSLGDATHEDKSSLRLTDRTQILGFRCATTFGCCKQTARISRHDAADFAACFNGSSQRLSFVHVRCQSISDHGLCLLRSRSSPAGALAACDGTAHNPHMRGGAFHISSPRGYNLDSSRLDHEHSFSLTYLPSMLQSICCAAFPKF